MIGAAPSVAEGIGTQSVKVLLVRMCLYLVGTHESMFSFTNVCLRSVCMWVFCWVSMNEVISFEENVCIMLQSVKVMLLRICVYDLLLHIVVYV